MAYRFFCTYGIKISDNEKDINYVLLSLSIVKVFIDSI